VQYYDRIELNAAAVSLEEMNFTTATATLKAMLNVQRAALPKPPVNFNAVSTGPTTAQLSWSPGGQDPVDSYVLRVRRRGAAAVAASSSEDGEIVDITVSEYTVTDLTAFTTYVAEVFAVNNIGRSLPASVEFVTAEDGEISAVVSSYI
jgi:hypothetical protein